MKIGNDCGGCTYSFLMNDFCLIHCCLHLCKLYTHIAKQVLMTPNIHAHYTDHGQLQFCSVILKDNVEINFGATIMPLTQYEKGCRLRPHAVTVKGQICQEKNEFFGNPCRADISAKSMEYGVLLFPGQGSVSAILSSCFSQPLLN